MSYARSQHPNAPLRMHGRGNDSHGGHSGAGYVYLHSAIDDRSRIIYSETHRNEQASTAAGFWTRAAAWYASIGITCERASPTTGPATAPGCGTKRAQPPPPPSRRRVRTGPRPKARSNGSTASCWRNGHTSLIGPQKPNEPKRSPGSSITTITADPTEHSDGSPQSTPSGTTSPHCTTSRRE